MRTFCLLASPAAEPQTFCRAPVLVSQQTCIPELVKPWCNSRTLGVGLTAIVIAATIHAGFHCIGVVPNQTVTGVTLVWELEHPSCPLPPDNRLSGRQSLATGLAVTRPCRQQRSGELIAAAFGFPVDAPQAPRSPATISWRSRSWYRSDPP